MKGERLAAIIPCYHYQEQSGLAYHAKYVMEMMNTRRTRTPAATP